MTDRQKQSDTWRIREILIKSEVTVLFVLIVLVTFLSVMSPYFFTVRNLLNVLRQSSIITILALGQALVIITGGIDLSVGSLIGFTASLGAWAALHGAPPLVTLIIILGSGGIVGMLNGLMVTKIGLPPFIATLGTMSIVRGLSLLITMGVPIRYSETWISKIGGGMVGIVPIQVILMLSMVIIVGLYARNTVSGREIYAIGSNERAARLSGVPVDRIRILVFSVTGLFAGICGLILMGQLGGSDAFYGNGLELDVIAAAVIGGISMRGGEGNVVGVIIGAAIMAVIKNGFVLLAVPGYWQTVAVGTVIIVAVSIDSIRRRKT